MPNLLPAFFGPMQVLIAYCGFLVLFTLLLIAASSSAATKRIIRVIDALRNLYYASHKDREHQRINRRRNSEEE